MQTIVLFALAGLAPVMSTELPDKQISKELAEMYREDQADQARWAELGDDEASRRQAVRRDRALEITQAGLLEQPLDYYHAAMLFQHGSTADDYLLAHVLATVAAVEGEKSGFFLSAAALDRFLTTRDEPQRFGSQSFDEAGTDLGDTSKLLSEAFVEVFRQGKPYPRSGLSGKPIDEEVRTKKALKAAAKELAQIAKDVSRSSQAAGVEYEAALRTGCTRAMELVAAGLLEEPEDFYAAGQVLEHGASAEELLAAHICATAACLLESKNARALYARTLDAWLRALDHAPVFAEPKAGETPPAGVLALHAKVRAKFSGKP